MQWLREFYERIKNIWVNMPKSRKIGFIGAVAVIIASLSVYYFLFGKTTYVPLFSNLTTESSGEIVQKLDEMGMVEGKDYKLGKGGTSILVDEMKVDRLRIDLAVDGALPENGTGFEIFDNAGFAITDEDREIMYQRALEGELQRSIMALSEVDYARVHLSMPQESVFVKEPQKGSASIVLRLKPAKELTAEQVKGIVSLVSGAVKDIPPENVQVLDSDANLLSADLAVGEQVNSVDLAKDSMEMKKQFEKQLAKDIQLMLEKALGQDKVLVTVNADLNFDSQESTVITYNEPKIKNYTQKIQIENGQSVTESLSPLDNNTQYTVQDPNQVANTPGINTYEMTQNNEFNQTTVHNIKAPGSVSRLSTSVVVDGDLSEPEKESIKGIVAAATGFNAQRGDQINVASITFDRTAANKMVEQLAAEEKQYKRAMLIKNIVKYAGIAAGILAAVIALILIRRRSRAEDEFGHDEHAAVHMGEPHPMPVEEVIEDATIKLNPNKQDPTEREIKEFATDAPDKVAEIVKTWILKDEG